MQLVCCHALQLDFRGGCFWTKDESSITRIWRKHQNNQSKRAYVSGALHCPPCDTNPGCLWQCLGKCRPYSYAKKSLMGSTDQFQTRYLWVSLWPPTLRVVPYRGKARLNSGKHATCLYTHKDCEDNTHQFSFK